MLLSCMPASGVLPSCWAVQGVAIKVTNTINVRIFFIVMPNFYLFRFMSLLMLIFGFFLSKMNVSKKMSSSPAASGY